jgi:hypothetical protein
MLHLVLLSVTLLRLITAFHRTVVVGPQASALLMD